jgi:hypothetical protein
MHELSCHGRIAERCKRTSSLVPQGFSYLSHSGFYKNLMLLRRARDVCLVSRSTLGR